MYEAPLVVGVRQFSTWEEAGSVEATLTNLGVNTGNMMFTQALISVLKGAKWGSFGLFGDQLEGRDAIVIACANWINDFEDFGWLTDRLEKTKLPVILVGIGAQSSLSKDVVPQPKAGTRRLLALAQDRSRSISARGQFTCETLAKLGVGRVVSTGCPSLLLAGPEGPVLSSPVTLSYETTCLHGTRHGGHLPSPFDAELYKLAFAKGMDIILQSETPDIYQCLGQSAPAAQADKFAKALLDAYGAPDAATVAAYLGNHGRAFANYGDWIAYMKTKSFCFGTRIHGTIASLLAGTPATLIAHDSRTWEMAKSMSIPHLLKDEVETIGFDDLNALYSAEAMAKLTADYPKYLQNFENFFNDNGLELSERFAAPALGSTGAP